MKTVEQLLEQFKTEDAKHKARIVYLLYREYPIYLKEKYNAPVVETISKLTGLSKTNTYKYIQAYERFISPYSEIELRNKLSKISFTNLTKIVTLPTEDILYLCNSNLLNEKTTVKDISEYVKLIKTDKVALYKVAGEAFPEVVSHVRRKEDKTTAATLLKAQIKAHIDNPIVYKAMMKNVAILNEEEP